MAHSPRLIEILRDTTIATVRRDGPDLTARQLAVVLLCSLNDPPHTVRGLATTLRVAKPAITRAADRLEQLGLTRRAADKRDRRSVLIEVTAAGRSFVEELDAMMAEASDAGL
jgi:DNA-binding MarR family transcriptional regulator